MKQWSTCGDEDSLACNHWGPLSCEDICDGGAMLQHLSKVKVKIDC